VETGVERIEKEENESGKDKVFFGQRLVFVDSPGNGKTKKG
jgi:hypothetical protein